MAGFEVIIYGRFWVITKALKAGFIENNPADLSSNTSIKADRGASFASRYPLPTDSVKWSLEEFFSVVLPFTGTSS